MGWIHDDHKSAPIVAQITGFAVGADWARTDEPAILAGFVSQAAFSS